MPARRRARSRAHPQGDRREARRTIRIALWTGEEEGYFGSVGYVQHHFGDIKTLALKPEHAKLGAYFNLDNGSGRIRGVNLQGNEAVRPIFERISSRSTISARRRSRR